MLYLIMAGQGLAWGLTIPMTKLAVSTGHHPIGLIAWQTILMSVFLTVLVLLRGASFPLSRGAMSLYAVIALTGTLVPNSFSYRAAAELPAGIMAIIIALVPMFALPIAVGMGLERPQLHRLGGLILGALAVVLLVAPEASLPAASSAAFVLVALVAPFCYGIEGNYIAWRGTGGLDSVQVLWGASVAAALVAAPFAWGTGRGVDLGVAWGPAEWGLLISSTAHAVAYVGYVWLVGRAGSVFAAQVAYVVTAAGVLWSMILLGERYSGWVWLAFALMLAGLALVQPKPEMPPAPDEA